MLKRIIIALPVLLGLTLLGVFWLRPEQTRPSATEPPGVLAAIETKFPVYYPSKLPTGYVIDSASITKDNDVVLYKIAYDQGKPVAVSIQAKPKEVLFDDFYSRLLKNKADVFSNYGKAVIGQAEGQTIGSLVSEDAWVLLTAPQQIDTLEMTQLVASLKPVR